MNELIRLNLERDILEGWEHFYDSLNVGVLRLARNCGQEFPPVDVVREEGIYRLVFGLEGEWWNKNNYGGHSRSILAFQDKYLLSCRVLPAHRKDPKLFKDESRYPSRDIEYIPIREMQPLRNISTRALGRLKTNLQFLPVELRERFMAENDIVVMDDGDLIDRETLENPPPF
ncbi:MAG: hypothetical protein AABX17_00655 [Nanoarchaeota archaeon]